MLAPAAAGSKRRGRRDWGLGIGDWKEDRGRAIAVNPEGLYPSADHVQELDELGAIEQAYRQQNFRQLGRGSHGKTLLPEVSAGGRGKNDAETRRRGEGKKNQC
jgi:hypothetical protein